MKMSKTKKREQEAYRFIKQKIVSKEWLPQKHIREQDVAKQLEMSRTPIRNAFLQLAEDQLIEIEPYKGAKILPLKIDSKAFQERAEFIELMTNHYFFKLEKTEKQLELHLLKQLLQNMNEFSRAEAMDFEQEEWRFWEALLELEANRYSRSMILSAVREMLPEEGKIQNVLSKSRLTKLKHYNQLLEYLEVPNYPYARREIRIMLNQLLLNIIQSMNE